MTRGLQPQNREVGPGLVRYKENAATAAAKESKYDDWDDDELKPNGCPMVGGQRCGACGSFMDYACDDMYICMSC